MPHVGIEMLKLLSKPNNCNIYAIQILSLIAGVGVFLFTHVHISEGWDLLIFLSSIIALCVVCVVFLTVLIRYINTKPVSKIEKHQYKWWCYTFIGIFLLDFALFVHMMNCTHIVEGVENIEETNGQWQRV